MKYEIYMEQTKSIKPQFQLIIRNIETGLNTCVGHCAIEDKDKFIQMHELRTRLELVLND
jgi:hypothetical protein